MLESLPISFARPIWLCLLGLLPLFWWLERSNMVVISSYRRRWARILRTTIVTLIVFALAGFQIIRTSDRMTVIFALDRSDSTREMFDETMDDLALSLETKEKNDQTGVIVFGNNAYVEDSPGLLADFGKIETVTESEHTDLSSAIRLGMGLFPDDTQRRLILVTDGNENLGDALAEATTAAANGVPIDIISMEQKVQEEVLVEEIGIPPSVDKDEPFDVKITVRASEAGPAKLRLYKNGAPVGTKDVELSPGKNIYNFTETQEDEGFYTYSVVVESLFDTLNENNNGTAYVRVFGKPQVLIVGNDIDRQYLSQAMEGQNWDVEAVYDLPYRRAQFENYDAIVLANISAEQFSNNQLQLLHDFVHDQAGGLIMVGGEYSFGLGLYGNTPVEEALPVNMELSNKRYFPSLSMALVIDKSGSMSAQSKGISKMKLAATACKEAVQILTPRDQVMVVAFDGNPKEVVPLGVIGSRIGEINRNIEGIVPGGGTIMYPAFNEAYKALASTQSQLKHIILLTDGRTQPGDFVKLARDCMASNITVSCVAVGPDADVQLMQTIAGQGGGRFYHALDAYQVPQIFARETYIAQRAYIIEEPFYPEVYQENQIIRGIETFPEVKGYIATEAKERTEMVLLTHKGDPLLAVWRYGLGKSLAFTSDARARWLQNWIGWEGFNKFWPQAIRWVLRSQQPSELYPNVRIENGKGHIVVDAVTDDNQFINFLELRGRVNSPEGSEEATQDIELQQTSPGRYEGTFPARSSGSYLVRIYGAEDQGIMPATAGDSVSYPPEYRDLEPNQLLLNRIVDKTGGRLNPPLTELYKRENLNVKQRYDLWFWLLMAAVLLFPFDIAIRRIYLDEEQKTAIRAFFGRFVPRLPQRAQVDETEHQATMAALKRTKEGVASRRYQGGGVTSEQTDGSPISQAAESAKANAAQQVSASEAADETSDAKPKVFIRKPDAEDAVADSASGDQPATLSRLRRVVKEGSGGQAGSSSTTSPINPSSAGEASTTKPAEKPKPFIARPDADTKSSSNSGDDGGSTEGLSYTQRLLEARKKAQQKK
jgi:uncharacterized membrane protein